MGTRSSDLRHLLQRGKAATRPLLVAYNRSNGTRYRLHIRKQRQLEVKLLLRSAKLFETFTLLANTSSLHPLDWRRFMNSSVQAFGSWMKTNFLASL